MRPRTTAAHPSPGLGTLAAFSCLLSACLLDWNRLSMPSDAGADQGVADVGPDARDASVDALADAGDASLEASPPDAAEEPGEAGAEAGAEAGFDARPEASLDAGPEPAAEASVEPGPEAGPEAAVDVAGCNAHLVLNEFSPAGPLGADDEFVELYNTGTCTMSLEGWTLRYSSAGGSTPATRWTGTVGNLIAPGGYFLLASPTLATYAATRNGTFMTGLAATGGALGLYAPSATAPHDSVAYGSAASTHPLAEGAMPAPAPPSALMGSLARTPNGADSNVNASDFTARTMNSAGAAN